MIKAILTLPITIYDSPVTHIVNDLTMSYIIILQRPPKHCVDILNLKLSVLNLHY